MVSKQELQDFLKGKTSLLNKLERKRKIFRFLLVLYIISLVLTICSIIIPLLSSSVREYTGNSFPLDAFLVTIIPLCIFTIVVIIKYVTYANEYANKIAKEAISFIDNTWTIEKKGVIPENIYNDSFLFTTKEYETYEGENLIEGKIKEVNFMCSELKTSYSETRTKIKKGRRVTQVDWHTIFNGLFSCINFNKQFSEMTMVRTKKIKSDTLGLSMINNLENATFNDFFDVYSSDAVEVANILTPAVMEAFVDLAKHYHDEPILFSFSGTRAYGTLSVFDAIYSVPVFKTIYELKELMGFYTFLYTHQVIIEELDQNNELWERVADLKLS
ncbi:DUF3137 domain-containing protein [Flammeovirga aprica]|uniref:DUF3137 domain-containing protein n=1 Tax=Flammeovirga aprica JL-4 TaxID=694437 RepID=A0A7X9S0N3_9BACT|nr:DUF3137 domain-containing protein [Flammeovirga aprica]NME72240.1 DUF3137 domain-containing protein [Flammeovirga aprica JL-4]